MASCATWLWGITAGSSLPMRGCWRSWPNQFLEGRETGLKKHELNRHGTKHKSQKKEEVGDVRLRNYSAHTKSMQCVFFCIIFNFFFFGTHVSVGLTERRGATVVQFGQDAIVLLYLCHNPINLRAFGAPRLSHRRVTRLRSVSLRRRQLQL